MSRPRPRVWLGGLAGRLSRPKPGGRLAGLAGGVQGQVGGGGKSQHALRQTPPPQQMATAAGSMHHTGMHSCCHWIQRIHWIHFRKCIKQFDSQEIIVKFCSCQSVNWVFPSLWLNKFIKLVKNINNKQNFGGDWTQSLRLQVWFSQIGHCDFCTICASNNHKFHELPCMTGFLSNWTNWTNLTKKVRIEEKLECALFTQASPCLGWIAMILPRQLILAFYRSLQWLPVVYYLWT